ncbi:MAG: site-specific tyrosine recombinase/integron integrase [Candidatus Xenobia bacterium]
MDEMSDLAKARGWYVRDFIGWLAVERGLSPRTLREYEKDLAIFLGYFEPHFQSGLTLEGMDGRTIREFLTWLKTERQYSPQALNRKIACLKSYFRFLEREEHIPASPMRDVHSVKVGRRLPDVLTQQEVEKLLTEASGKPPARRNVTRPDEEKLLRVRDRAILEMFYATGVRISELVAVNVEDLDFHNLMLKVRGKGNKERVVLMNETCAASLQAWIAVRPTASDRALFLSRLKRRISRRAVEYLVERHLQNAEIHKPASPHTLRHSFGTHMVEGGADLMAVKELLGHENLSTTQIYVNVAMQHIREVYRRTHPRAGGQNTE